MRASKEYRGYYILAYAALTVFALYMLLPFVLLFMSSVTEEKTLLVNGYSFFPAKFSLNAYRYIFDNAEKIFRAYGVTALVTVIGTAVSLTLASLMAFPLSQPGLPGGRAIAFFVFFTMLFNGGLAPTYMVYTQMLGVRNSLLALIMPNFLLGAVNVLLIRSYLKNSIPPALIEAAQIDGAGYLTVFLRIALPLSKPILVTTGVFSALTYWNDWTNALYYVSNQQLWGVQSLLNKMITDIAFLQSGNATSGMMRELGEIPSASVRMAIAFTAMLPILAVYPFLQKYFARGITLGAVKG